MSTLNPSQAAAIATGVYALRERNVGSALDVGGKNALGTEGLFAADADSSRFSGTSGMLMFKPLSGFGFIAAGTGQFAGDLLIATRGTDVAADWMTDANFGIQRGPAGELVHAGFNETWKSFIPQIREFLRLRNPTRIHCVGHSLGGALAFLNADYIAANRIADVRLYTFGAPRTGGHAFARKLTDTVGAENIFRVSNPVDPVPMIPLFPFCHLPFNEEGLQISRTSNMPISFAGHKMRDSYVPGVAGKAWGNLRVAGPDEREVKRWLEEAAEGQGGFIMGSAKLLDMIGRALQYMLKQAGSVLAGGVGIGLTVFVTLLDRVAYMLTKAAQISLELGTGLVTLINMIFRFLGRKAIQGAQITTAFLRWVLDLLFSSLSAAARRALSIIG
ncbi:MAG: lipase family protein [Burkholderiaceae bacterium]